MKKIIFLLSFVFCVAFMVESSAMEVPIENSIEQVHPDSVPTLTYLDETFAEGATALIEKGNVYYTFVDHGSGDVYINANRTYQAPKDPPSVPNSANIDKWVSSITINIGIDDNNGKGVADISYNGFHYGFVRIGNIRF